MADFKQAFAHAMRVEGGYANNKLDTGGETYMGISRRYNPKWKCWPVIDAIQPHTANNINKVAGSNSQLQEYIRAFYKTNYWDINRLSEINDQQLANNVFDFGVNAGTKKAAKFLQMSYNTVQDGGLIEDGIIGSKTIASINAESPCMIYGIYNKLRKDFYDSIIANNPSQSVFRKSWYSRIKPYK